MQIDTPAGKYSTIGYAPPTRPSAVETLYRADWGRIVATLIRLVGDFDLAEECAQEAFAAAVDQWQLPASRISRAPGSSKPPVTKPSTAFAAGSDMPKSFESYVTSGFASTAEQPDYDSDEIPDDRLRLIFTCCHPALARKRRWR